MEEKLKNAIEKYQCSGCVSGHNITCFSQNTSRGIGCGKHHAGTSLFGIGNVFLGMPKGFNRLGEQTTLKPNIFEKFETSDWPYDVYNVPVWKYLSEDGHTFVRGMMPRKNEPFLHVFLENCIEKINCREISKSDYDFMD